MDIRHHLTSVEKHQSNGRVERAIRTVRDALAKTKKMGSYVHANYLKENKIPIKGMICLETIGFYSDKPHSQKYPIIGMSLKYGEKR